MNETSAALRAQAADLLAASNALSETRLSAAYAELDQHAKDLIAAQVTAQAQLHQILVLRVRYHEARGE